MPQNRRVFSTKYCRLTDWGILPSLTEGGGIIAVHFVRNISFPDYNLCIDQLQYNCTNLLTETTCSDLDPGPHIKGQGHTSHFKGQSTHLGVLL